MAKNKNVNKRISNVKTNRYNSQNVAKEREKINDGIFIYQGKVNVSTLAEKLGLMPNDIIKFLFLDGKMVNINSVLDDELIGLVCLNFGYDFKKEVEQSNENFEDLEIKDKPEDLKSRPAVVTIMGHVDHGKTTLLDKIRKSRVVEGEFGGITQAIGAYQIEYSGQKITFLDTPGHEAFAAMRARGADVTDIVILVVAADDGVMPQTREAIDHAKFAKVPIIVAVNKIDKPGADSEKIKMALADLDLLPEEWGGETIYKLISAKFGQGIEELLETILLVSEIKELKANPNRYAIGRVIEAELNKGLGPVATLIVQNGSLNVGDPIIAGSTFGKIRNMYDDTGRQIKTANPSTPVMITGLSEVPSAGDNFMAFADEKQAREIAATRHNKKIDAERESSSVPTSLEDLFAGSDAETQTVNIIIKADSQGSAEAVKNSLEKINVSNIKLHIIRFQAGTITESDVLLASSGKAIIYGFNVRPDAKVKQKAEAEHVEIRLHRIIYQLVEEMEAAMKGMLKPEFKEVVTGQAEVRKLFKVSKIGTIAGSYVTSGYLKANQDIRLIRDGIVILESKLTSLKRFQEDTKEVKTGFECGLTIEGYNDIKELDIVEGYVNEEIKK